MIRSIHGSSWLPLAQFLAIFLMTFDHVALWLSSESSADLYRLLLGRGALPFFAAMIAWHAVRTSEPWLYAFRVAFIAMLAQPAFSLLRLDIGLGVSGNICWIFSAAIVLITLFRTYSAWFPLALAVVVYFSTMIEYGLAGLFLVLSLALAFRYPLAWFLPVLVWPILQYGGTLYAYSAFSWCLLLMAIVHYPVTIPRLPRLVTRAFYPIHLYCIFLLRLT